MVNKFQLRVLVFERLVLALLAQSVDRWTFNPTVKGSKASSSCI